MKHLFSITTIILLLLLFYPNLIYSQPSIDEWSSKKAMEIVLKEMNISNIRYHVYQLTNHGSRFSGYEGYEWNSKYIYNYLVRKLNLTTWIWKYKGLIPYDYNSTLTVISPRFLRMKAYAFLPNMIQTCKTSPNGITGKLIYLGQGKKDDYQGKDVNGSIVLMDYNTKSNWMTAMNLGAKAVIFIKPTYTVRGEGDYKVLKIPINFPRVMISSEDGNKLVSLLKDANKKGNKVIVRLNVNMFWKETELKNIFVLIPGTDGYDKYKDIIMIASYYDAFGIIPAFSPGADEACSPAALLEFARILSKHRPKRTVLLAFFSGQGLSMAGTRKFADNIFFMHWNKTAYFQTNKGKIPIRGDQIRAVFVFDFSTDSSMIALINQGTFYGGFDVTRAGRIIDIETYIKRKIGGKYNIADYTYTIGNKKYHVYFSIGRLNRDLLPSHINHIGEVFNFIGIFSMTFYTAQAARVIWGTPVDSFDNVNFKMLLPQVEFSYIILYIILSDPRIYTTNLIHNLMHGHSRSAPLGFALLRGKISYYNYSRAWFESNWKNILSKDEFIIVYVELSYTLAYKHYFIVKANSTGDFTIPGLKPSGWALGAFTYHIYAFVLNNKTGNIEWAPDNGFYGRKLWPYGNSFLLSSDLEVNGLRPVNVVLFKCGTIVLHDIIDPTTFSSPLVSQIEPYTFKVYNSESNAELVTYGYVVSVPPSPILTAEIIRLGIGDPAVGYDTVIYVPPNVSVSLVFKSLNSITPLGIIKNVRVNYGEYKDIKFTAFTFADEMIKIVKNKLGHLQNEPTLSGSISKAIEYYNNALVSYDNAFKKLNKREYVEAYSQVYRSWYLARKAYSIVREVYTDIVYTNVMLILLILPSTIILERLLFEKRGLKRIIYSLIIIFILIIISYILHPGLRVAWNSIMATISIASFILAIPPLLFIILGTMSTAKEIREKTIGKHFIDISRMSAYSIAFSLGVGNIKKRRIRAILTLTSIISLILSLVLFTSWSFSDQFVSNKIIGHPYKGLLIKTGEESITLTPSLLESLEGYFNPRYICPRVWLKSPTQGFYALNNKGEISYVKAIIGLSSNEPLIKGCINKDYRGLLGSFSRIAIVTKDIANELNLTIGSTINIAGIKLVVIDIVNQDILAEYLKDMDGTLITPRDPLSPPGSPVRTYNRIVIIPFGLAIRLGGMISSISIPLENYTKNYIIGNAMNISEQLSFLQVYYSDGNESYLASWIRSYQIKGVSYISIPLIIVLLSILNIMVTSVYERLHEIKIYSVLGFSPKHVAAMIFAEGIIYGILGATLGYIISLFLAYIMSFMGERYFPIDFSSPYPILSILLSLVTVVIAGVYPSIKASGYVTPSFERKYRIPTKPRENMWYIPLPMLVKDIKNTYGILLYVSEFLESVSMEDKFTLEEFPKYFVKEEHNRKVVGFNVKVRLPPYDAAVTENVKLIAEKSDKGISFGVNAQLLTGKRYVWIMSHKRFVDLIRKQLFAWKSIRLEEKRKYILMGIKKFEKGDVDER